MEDLTSNRGFKRNQDSQSTEAPSLKQQKTSVISEWSSWGEWSDGTVSSNFLNSEYGVCSAKAISRLQEQRPDVEDIIRLIENTSQLSPFGLDKIFFHASFKAALTDILTDITSKPHKIHLIHGVPKIGKSCLAMCLSYYLALEGGSAAFVTANYTRDTDCDRATRALYEYTHFKWVVVDGCDVNELNQQKLEHFVTVSGDKRLVIFTSGHCIPNESWLDSPGVNAKVISMHADSDAVHQLNNAYGLGEHPDLTNEVVLQVSRIYGHICEFLHVYKRYKAINPDEDMCSIQTLKQMMYRFDDMVMLSDKYDIFWLLWPNLAIKSNRDTLEWLDSDETECLMIEPCQMAALSCRLLELPDVDARDKSVINAVMNWMDVTMTQDDDNMERHDEDEGYLKYLGTSYRYYFPHFDILKPILVAAFKKCTLQRKLHEYFLDLYSKAPVVGPSAHKLRGMLFENLIRGVCIIPSKRKGVCVFSGYHGIINANTAHAGLIPVDKLISTPTVENLCEEADQFLQGNTNANMFCVLTAPGKHIGYVFAYVHIHRGVKEIQLSQATVTPVSHRKTLLKSTLAEMERFKFTDRSVKVVAHLVVPVEYRINIDVKGFGVVPMYDSLALL